MFQNLRINSQLYILHKDSSPRMEYGTVVRVSSPRPKYPAALPQIGQYPQLEMVVDVVASVNGQETNLQGLPAGVEIADFGQNGNIVVSCSRDAMNGELAMMKQKSVDVLGSIEYHKQVIAACDKMVSDLNPEFAAKQRQDEEIAGLKSQLAEMSQNMANLMAMNKRMMEQFGTSAGTTSKK